jgi:hypothetical protein
MADEQETIAPAPELETPAIETPEVETPEVEKPETVELPGAEPEQETEEQLEAPAIEFVTLERNGKQYQVPKELEGEFLMQSDYTKKTQTVAEKVKALESREAEINQRLQATDEELDMRAELRSAKARIEQYAALSQEDWDAHYAKDYPATDRAWREYQMLKEKSGTLAQTLEAKATERTQKAEQDLATRVEETISFAQKEIPGWKPELTETLVKYAVGEGVPEDLLKTHWSPVLYKLLHQAHIGKQLMSKPAPTPKAVTPAPAPLEKVTGKSTPAAAKTLGDLAKSDDLEAYANARKAGRVR